MERSQSQNHLEAAPWRKARTPREQSRGRTGGPSQWKFSSDAVCASPQSAASPLKDQSMFEAEDFPRLNGTTDARPKTPKRERSRHATPKTPRRDPPIGAKPQVIVASKSASQLSRPIGAPAEAPAKKEQEAPKELEAKKSAEPARATSLPPAHIERASSMPPDNVNRLASSPPSQQACQQAVNAAKVHGRVNGRIESLIRAAEQVRTTNCRNTSDLNTFLKEFTDAVQDIKESHPRLPAGATEEDTAALLALNLILDATKGRHDIYHNNGLEPIEEGRKLQKASSEAYLPTPCRSSRVRFSDSPGDLHKPAAPYSRGTPNWFQTGASRVLYAPSYPPGNFFGTSGAHLRAISAEPPVAINRKKTTVVNPRTGERLVVSSVVPFEWRQKKRMKITNPRTGEEVLPYGHITADDLQAREKEYSSGRPRSSSVGVAGRASIGSVASSACQSTTSTIRRRSIVGGAVKEGSSWALEPASGGFWDWPLSRQEKKERFLLLGQLQMATEIEELECKIDELSM